MRSDYNTICSDTHEGSNSGETPAFSNDLNDVSYFNPSEPSGTETDDDVTQEQPEAPGLRPDERYLLIAMRAADRIHACLQIEDTSVDVWRASILNLVYTVEDLIPHLHDDWRDNVVNDIVEAAGCSLETWRHWNETCGAPHARLTPEAMQEMETEENRIISEYRSSLP